MPFKSDAVRLQHMLAAAREAVGYTKGRGRADLDVDRPLIQSLVRCVEILGEAAARTTPELRRAHPEIQWQNIIGMRNRLIHAYHDVNLGILWKTATEELPDLIAALERLLPP